MSHTTSWMLTAMLLLFAACEKSDKGRQHLLLSSSFEGTSPFSDWENNQHCCDYSLTQSAVRATDGPSSLRLEVRSTDPIVSSSIRSELVQPEQSVGTERWYGFSMFLENWQDDDAGESILQWHPSSAGGSAVGSIFASHGHYEFVTTNYVGTNGNGYSDLGPIMSNQWVAWVIHVKWATDTSGIIQVWKNGKLVLDVRNTANSPDIPCYFKLGINKFGWGIQTSSTTQRVLYYDDVRIGDAKARYEDVKPGS